MVRYILNLLEFGDRLTLSLHSAIFALVGYLDFSISSANHTEKILRWVSLRPNSAWGQTKPLDKIGKE